MQRKVKELKDCVGISCERYEEQFIALLIAIEASQHSLAKSATRKEKELKKLLYSINYDKEVVLVAQKAKRWCIMLLHELKNFILECKRLKHLLDMPSSQTLV